MRKLLYIITLLSYSLPCFASNTQTNQSTSIQFNNIPALDTIIAAIPSSIQSFTMDLTNACTSLTDAAQAYEDAAAASKDFQVQGDYYFNAAQAYLAACKLVTNTTTNIGSIGQAQDITYIQSYRCAALEAFNQSFEAYLTLCLQNANTPLAASIAANAALSLADFLTNLINLNNQQLNLLTTLAQSSPNFASFQQSYQPNSSCWQACWYPVQLPGEDTANCEWKRFKVPANPTQYTGLLSHFNNPSYPVRYYFGFQPNTPSIVIQSMGTPGQQMLNEGPADDGTTNHIQGWLSSPTQQGAYVANGSIGSASNPLYDMGYTMPSLGSLLLPYPQILDPYSINDPNANQNIINIIPQPQYIYAVPTPTTVQNLHDAIRDYMYSADINKIDSYAYNSYINITAKNSYPEDILPAISKMNTARMNVVECYEGAILKIVAGLTGKTSISPSIWNNLTGTDQTNAITAAECIVIILPMYNSIIQQIATYDIPFLSAFSSLQKAASSSTSQPQNTNTQAAAQAAQQSASGAIQKAQATYQQAQTNQTANQQTASAASSNSQTSSNTQTTTFPLQSTEQALQAQQYKIAASASATQAAAQLALAQQAANQAPQDQTTQKALALVLADNQKAQQAATAAATFVTQAIQATTSGNQTAAATNAFAQGQIVANALQSAKDDTQKVIQAAQNALQAVTNQQAAQQQSTQQQAQNIDSEIQAYKQYQQNNPKFQSILNSISDPGAQQEWIDGIMQNDTAWIAQWNAQQAQPTLPAPAQPVVNPTPAVTSAQTPPVIKPANPVPTPATIQPAVTATPTNNTTSGKTNNSSTTSTANQASTNKPATVKTSTPVETSTQTPPVIKPANPVPTPVTATPTNNTTSGKTNNSSTTSTAQINHSSFHNIIAELFEKYEETHSK